MANTAVMQENVVHAKMPQVGHILEPVKVWHASPWDVVALPPSDFFKSKEAD